MPNGIGRSADRATGNRKAPPVPWGSSEAPLGLAPLKLVPIKSAHQDGAAQVGVSEVGGDQVFHVNGDFRSRDAEGGAFQVGFA
jgi:hypothetical protein